VPITLPVVATADNRSFDRIGDQAEKHFGKAGQDAGKAFAKGLDEAASKADPKSVERWTKAYDKVADSTGKVRVEEAKLAEMRQRGASDTRLIAQSEALERARRAEVRATREAANAYRDFESSAKSAGTVFDKLIGSARDKFGPAGEQAADDFLGGLTGASSLARIASATGPIGLALTAAAALGFGAGKMLAGQIEQGMAALNIKDTFAARIGVNDATMQKFGSAAGKAFSDNWGASVEENLRVVQFAIQGGLIDTDATEADVQKLIGQIQSVSTLIGEDSQSIARGLRNFIKSGLVGSTEEGLDLLVAASQRGLNISGDLIDTLEEYGTKFRDIGLSGADALGLIAQMQQAGIRNTDVAADALKEFAIRAVDGSDTTNQAFAALGFGADDMAKRFAAGGDTARQAFGEVLTALNGVSDPLQQEIIGTALFGTKWEDAGDAIKNANLGTAATELGNMEGATKRASDKIGEHASQWDALDKKIDQTFSNWKQWLADTAIGKFLNQDLPQMLGGALDNGGYLFNFPAGEQNPIEFPGGLGGGLNAQRERRGLDPIGPDGNPIPRTAPIPMTPGGSGSGGPGQIVLPYPTQYGQPPMPGESDQQYQARMADIMADHNLAQAQARVDQLKADRNAEQSDIISAENALIEARMRASESERRYVESMMPQAQGITVPFDPRYGQGPRPGQTAEQYANESKLLEARQKSAQAAAEYEQLMASGTATASELTKAHNDLVAALRDENEVSMRLSETSTKTTQQLGDIGAQLDADFGFSRGLPGIAENLTKFLANLAFAPVLGALKGVEAAGGYDEKTMGSGLAGMIGGALGLGKPTAAAAATGPQLAAGPQRPITSQQQFLGGAATGIDAALLARVPAGRYTQEERGDLTQGLADCTSSIEDLVNILDGRPTGGASLSTSNADQWLLERGFMPNTTGAPVPGAFNVGFWDGPGNQGHMQATLPDGTNFNWGSNASAANRGIGGTGAFDPAMTSQYYRPVSGMPTSSVAAMPRSATLSGLPLPLPVTIVGGMGSGPLATPAPASGGPASTSTPTTAATPGGGYAPLTPSQLTSPGLTTPTPLGGGGIGSGAGLPGLAGAPQAGGGSGLFGMLGSLGGGGMAPAAGAPGVGAPAGMAGTVGGTSPGGGPGGGGFGGAGSTGIGGMAMQGIQAGISAAGMALDATMPGAGTAAAMAANIGVQLGNRAIGQAGKAGGLLVGGIMETLLPSNSPLSNPNANWFGRIAAGFAGAKPALPNMTGQPADRPQGQQADPLNDPAAAGKAASSSSSSQSGVTVNYNNYQATEDRAGADLTNHLVAMNAAPGI